MSPCYVSLSHITQHLRHSTLGVFLSLLTIVYRAGEMARWMRNAGPARVQACKSTALEVTDRKIIGLQGQ